MLDDVRPEACRVGPCRRGQHGSAERERQRPPHLVASGHAGSRAARRLACPGARTLPRWQPSTRPALPRWHCRQSSSPASSSAGAATLAGLTSHAPGVGRGCRAIRQRGQRRGTRSGMPARSRGRSGRTARAPSWPLPPAAARPVSLGCLAGEHVEQIDGPGEVMPAAVARLRHARRRVDPVPRGARARSASRPSARCPSAVVQFARIEHAHPHSRIRHRGHLPDPRAARTPAQGRCRRSRGLR